jgi:hypothetical protein
MALHETTGTGFRIENKFECGGIVGLANVCEFSDEWLRPEMVYDYEFSNSPARGGIGESSSGSVGEDSSKKKQSKQETQTACPLPSEVNRWDTLKASAGMFVDWATGTGAADREFGGDSIQSADMAMAPGVNGARSEYYRKFLDEISESRNPDLTGLNVTNWVGKFGVKEVLNATVDLNFTEHFVGSYRVDVYGGPEGTMRFVLSNNSSFKSFAYGVAPAWERLDSVPTPAGNMRQTYTWVECVP